MRLRSLALPIFFCGACERVEVRDRPRSWTAIPYEPMQPVRAQQIRAVRSDNVIEALNPHTRVCPGVHFIRNVVEHSLNKIRWRDALSQQSVAYHRVSHVLEDANHSLEALIGGLVLGRA